MPVPAFGVVLFWNNDQMLDRWPDHVIAARTAVFLGTPDDANVETWSLRPLGSVDGESAVTATRPVRKVFLGSSISPGH
jgi:hypothetical protein